MNAVFMSLFRYAQASLLSFMVNFGLTVGLHEVAGLPEEAAYAIALLTVFVGNFLTLRHYVYRTVPASIWGHGAKYAAASVSFRCSEYLTFLVVHTWLGLDYRLAVVGISGTSALCKFVFYRWLFEGAMWGNRSPAAHQGS